MVYHQEAIDKAISLLRFFSLIDDDISRIIRLVQENQDFFGNSKAGEGTIKIAADWLESQINIWKKQNDEIQAAYPPGAGTVTG